MYMLLVRCMGGALQGLERGTYREISRMWEHNAQIATKWGADFGEKWSCRHGSAEKDPPPKSKIKWTS